MAHVSNYTHGIVGGVSAKVKTGPGERWRCEYVDPVTGQECAAGGDTKRNSGIAPYRHDCFGHGGERGDFKRTYFACQFHYAAFIRAHTPGAYELSPGLVGANGARHSR